MPVVLRNRTAPAGVSLQDRIRNGAWDSLLLVVPTKRKQRHLLRELADTRAIGSSFLHTLDSFATMLFDGLWPERHIISGPARELLFRSALASVRNGLRYFSPRSDIFILQKGTFQKVVDVISVLKESGVTPDILNDEMEFAESDEKLKLGDVTLIYETYEKRLDAIGAVDKEGVFGFFRTRCTQQAFNTVFRKHFSEAVVASISGFDEFTEPELEFIRKLNEVPNLSVTLTFDFLPGNDRLFGHLQRNYDRFVELGFTPVESGDVQAGFAGLDHPQSGTSEHVARYLFSHGETGKTLDLADRATVVAARDRAEEVQFACRTIKQLLLEQPGLEASRICIAMPQPSPYTPLFREAFRAYGIPSNITDRYLLIESPLVVSVVSLLQLIARDFQRDDILKILVSPYCTIRSGEKRIDAESFSRVANRLRIVAGYRHWVTVLEKEQLRLSAIVDSGSAHSPAAFELDELRRALCDMQAIHHLLSGFAGKITAAQFHDRLVELLNQVELLTNTLRALPGEPEDAVERDMRAVALLLETLEETVRTMEQQDGPGAQYTLAQHLEYLSVALARERYNVREQFGRGVLVTSIEETRGLQFDVMILVGMVDGEFPSVYRPEVFYSLVRQQQRAQRHIWEQRYLFYQGVSNCKSLLYLSHPEQDGDLDLVRSSFIDEFLRIASCGEVKAGGHSNSPVYSEEELTVLLARSGFRNQALEPERMRQGLRDVERAIQVEVSRSRSHELPSYEGYIKPLISPAREALTAARQQTLSITQLETYGTCPFKFYSRFLLRLKAMKDFEEELGAMEKGSLIHAILFEFMHSRKMRKLPSLAGCDDDVFGQARKEILEIAQAKLTAMDIPDPFWQIEKENIIGDGDKIEGVLEEFLRVERASTAMPKFFEASFGPQSRGQSDGEISIKEPITIKNISLQGKIDRIEVGDDGVFHVVDYKSGKRSAKKSEIEDGTSLQLPVYLAVAEELLRRKTGKVFTPGSGLYYQLRSPVKRKVAIANRERTTESTRGALLAESDEELRSLIDASFIHANRFLEGIGKGEFPLTEQKRIGSVCRICEMKMMCRVQSYGYEQQPGAQP